MTGRFRKTIDILRGRPAGPGSLVKMAVVPTRKEMETCLEALLHRGIEAEGRQNPATGGLEIWTRARQEPQARLLLGLSGHSVIRIPRRRKSAARQQRG